MSKENVTRRISIYVNGKEVENSLKGIDGAVIHLRNQMRLLDLSTDEGKKRFAELSPEFEKAKTKQAEYRKELGLTKKEIDDSAGSFAKFKDGLLSGDFQMAKEGLSGIKAEMSNLVKTSLEFIATPIGAAVAGLVGFVAAGKAIFDFNQQAEKSAVLIENLSGKTGQVVEDIRIKMQSLTDTFGLTFDQLAGAVDNLVDTGVAKNELEALDKIKNGLLTAPDKNEFVASLESSALMAKQVGLSLEEVIALKQQIEAVGIDPEKTFGAFQKASAKLSTQADSLRLKLTEAFGASFTDEVLAKVKTGQLTTVQALDLIGKKSKEVGLNQTQQAQLSNELFGKAGLAAGGFATLTDAATQSLKKQNQELNGNQKALDELEKANYNLGKAQSELFRIKDFGELWTKIKASVIDTFASMLSYIAEFKTDIQPLIDIIGVVLVGAWINLKLVVVNAFDIIGATVKVFFDYLKFGFNFIKAIITGDFKGALDLVKNYFISLGDTVGNLFNKIKNNILNAIQGIVSNISPLLSALGLDVDKIQKRLESFKSKDVVLKTSTKNETSGPSGEKAVTKETAEELAKQKALRDAARQKEADARKAAADKKKAEQDKAAKEELDKLLALSKAKADLAKAELNYFIANNRSKLDSTKALTPEIIAAETARLDIIKDKQLTALAEERLSKVEKAQADAKSSEELAALKLTIDYDYETQRQTLELGFQTSTDELKKQYIEEQKVLKAEQLQADNELALAEADTAFEADKIKQQQDYADQLASYKKLYDDKKITEAEYLRFKAAAAKQQDEIDAQRRMNEVQAVLGGLNTLAGALGEMFGQSKELAIVQANISGAQAVLGIWSAPAVLPQPYDAILKGVLTAGVAIQTVSQINTIRKQKAPKKPKFFDGGHTGSDAIGYDQYGKIVGDVHDNEYVIPKAMTQSPRYANTIAWLEQERTGKPGRKFASGGASSPGVIPDVVMTENNSKMELLLQAVLHRLENPIAPNLLVGYDQAKAIQDLNNERDASTNNGIVSK